MKVRWFGWGGPVQVHLAYDADGKVCGVFSNRPAAEAASRYPVHTWTIDLPEVGPTIWGRDGKPMQLVPRNREEGT